MLAKVREMTYHMRRHSVGHGTTLLLRGYSKVIVCWWGTGLTDITNTYGFLHLHGPTKLNLVARRMHWHATTDGVMVSAMLGSTAYG